MEKRSLTPLVLAALLLLAAGCEAEEKADLALPSGWEQSGARAWRPAVDTTRAFRPLESLREMQIAGTDGTVLVPGRGGVVESQVVQAVKRSLLPLYRNEPQIVDSLFDRFVLPELRQNPLQTGAAKPYVEQYRRRGYELIRSHFREPLAATRLGTDVPVVYPDSLSENGVAGSVRMQVFLDDEGVPQAIQLLEGVHPVLDAVALRATTEMRWRPAYLLRKGSWHAIPAWVRFNVAFGRSDATT